MRLMNDIWYCANFSDSGKIEKATTDWTINATAVSTFFKREAKITPVNIPVVKDIVVFDGLDCTQEKSCQIKCIALKNNAIAIIESLLTVAESVFNSGAQIRRLAKNRINVLMESTTWPWNEILLFNYI